MKKEYTISVFTADQIGLLHRVSIVFTRRHINIHSITASESEIKGIHRYTIIVKETEEQVIKVVNQLTKQIDIVKAFFHESGDTIFQEIALYKIATKTLVSEINTEQIIRNHNARLLTVEPDFAIIEKTGQEHETQALFDELEPFGILEFVRSGRVAITKPMKELRTYMKEIKLSSLNQV